MLKGNMQSAFCLSELFSGQTQILVYSWRALDLHKHFIFRFNSWPLDWFITNLTEPASSSPQSASWKSNSLDYHHTKSIKQFCCREISEMVCQAASAKQINWSTDCSGSHHCCLEDFWTRSWLEKFLASLRSCFSSLITGKWWGPSSEVCKLQSETVAALRWGIRVNMHVGDIIHYWENCCYVNKIVIAVILSKLAMERSLYIVSTWGGWGIQWVRRQWICKAASMNGTDLHTIYPFSMLLHA